MIEETDGAGCGLAKKLRVVLLARKRSFVELNAATRQVGQCEIGDVVSNNEKDAAPETFVDVPIMLIERMWHKAAHESVNT